MMSPLEVGCGTPKCRGFGGDRGVSTVERKGGVVSLKFGVLYRRLIWIKQEIKEVPTVKSIKVTLIFNKTLSV